MPSKGSGKMGMGRERLYKLVAIIPWGGGENRVYDLHYLPAEAASVANNRRRNLSPFFRVGVEQYDEIIASAPKPLREATFRIVKEFDRTVDLEWVE